MTPNRKQLLNSLIDMTEWAYKAGDANTDSSRRAYLVKHDEARASHMALVDQLLAQIPAPVSSTTYSPKPRDSSLPTCPECKEKLSFTCWNTNIGAITTAHCTGNEPQRFPLPAGTKLCWYRGRVRRLGPNSFELVTE